MKQRNGEESEDKQSRQKAILEVLSQEEIATQEDLTAAMKRKGFDCTQTTVSRDFSELSIIKVGGVYRSLSNQPVGLLERAFAEQVLGATTAGENLIVLKTRVGGAQTVAIEMDRAAWDEVVGTVAGDDTIFVAVEGRKKREAAFRKVKRLLGGGQK